MSIFYNTRRDIEELFITQFALKRECVPVFNENVSYNPPSTPWVRISIVPNDHRRIDIWGNLYRTTGIVNVQVQTPLDIGAGEAERIADDVADIFRGVTLPGIRLDNPTPVIIGEQDKFYRIDVQTEYESDINL